jgi:hypothetical protein
MDQPSVLPQQAAEIGLLDALQPETGVVAGGALVLLVLARLTLGWLEQKRGVKSFLRHSILVGMTPRSLAEEVRMDNPYL